jgi:hypothetical protein
VGVLDACAFAICCSSNSLGDHDNKALIRRRAQPGIAR